MSAVQLIIITAICVAGLIVVYNIMKLILVVFVVGATAQIEKMKKESKDNEKSDNQQ